ncbi:MAG TPA: hypothetical protein VMC79_14760, partial [Rectinemataceae bacterium]|nr:hypothetical protein [Rectinemataceae bacterium]
DRAVELRYGPAEDLRDYCRKARLIQYESWRAMYEAYARFFPEGTGVIAWMLNNAWPNQVFHLYDWYLRPGGGFYGAQKACESIHIQYGYGENSIWAFNQTRSPTGHLRAFARVFDLKLRELDSGSWELELAARSGREIARLEKFDPAGGLSFVDLTLASAEGLVVSRNFYWLPATDDEFSSVHTFYHTALRRHADLSALAALPPSGVRAEARFREEGDRVLVEAELANGSETVCLLAEALVRDGPGGELVLPVLWEENMVSLLPGERRSLRGKFHRGGRDLSRLVVELSPFN